MGSFDAKWNAYEQAMNANNYFGVQGEARAEQMGRYAEGLQYDEIKAQKKAEGRAFAKDLAVENAKRQALTAKEQADLARGLGGNATPADFTTHFGTVDELRAKAPLGNIAPDVKPAEEATKGVGKSKVGDKMKVGTPKTGYKYYLVDKEGNTYEVTKKEYNSARKGKTYDFTGKKPLDPEARVPKKVQVAGNKVKEKAQAKAEAKAQAEPKPVTPEAPKPAPEGPKPATPEAPKPAPEAPKPATPEAPKPAPEAPKPVAPEAPKPAPSTSKPASNVAKSEGVLSKFGKFAKTGKGKAAIAGVILAGAAMATSYFLGVEKAKNNNNTNSNEDAVVVENVTEEPTNTTENKAQSQTQVQTQKEAETTPVTANQNATDVQENQAVQEQTAIAEADETEQKPPRQKIAHTVRDGENVWNIVKNELKLTSNADILRETLRVMSENNLHFEEDGYHCIIQPGQVINV